MNKRIKGIVYKLLYTCEQATQLIEKKTSSGSISFMENIRLKGHLLVCKFCNAYNKKVTLIDRGMSRLPQKQDVEVGKAEEAAFKKQLIESVVGNDL